MAFVGGGIIQIIEAFIEGKGSPEACEDIYYISDDFVAVIDGVTSKSDFRYNGKTTGRLAVELIQSVLKKTKRKDTLEMVLFECNKAFEELYSELEFPYNIKEKGMQAVAVIYSAYFRQIWLIGDCQVLVDGKLYENPKKSDVILADFRSLVLDTLFKDKDCDNSIQDYDEARNLILPWIVKSTIYVNDNTSSYGYALINGGNIPKELIKIINLDEGSHEVVLASDGYPFLKETLREAEEELSSILSKDPNCYRQYKSTKGVQKGCKSFDDRTYIRFKVH